MEKQYYVYLMTNKWDTVIYTRVTSDLAGRVFQHQNKVVDGFTSKYNINKLVYYEMYNDPLTAIEREKQIKAGSRKKKNELVEKDNPEWLDLSYCL
ncbi:GIY-YIG nuclease family protein [Patescibacteria group bacterium]